MNYTILAFIVALAIVLPLAFYAGKLLFQLKRQNDRQERARQARIVTLTESIRTIAFAVSQQQCNLSEGAIRLVNLLESMPVASPPLCERDYPALYELYVEVKGLATHEQRKMLDRQVREHQDRNREEHESRLETAILREVKQLSAYQA